jgi:hypothetical protein
MNLVDNLKRTAFIICINQDLNKTEFSKLALKYRKYLFPDNKNFRTETFDDVIIHYNKSNHILNKTFLFNDEHIFFFMTGDFFQELEIEHLKSISDENEFRKYILRINASFNAILYVKNTGTVIMYNDIIGLKKYFYGFKNKILLISSLLAAFYDDNTKYNTDYINDFIFTRVALTYETQFKNVFTVGPDFFISVDLKTADRKEDVHIREHHLMNFKSGRDVMQQYFSIFGKFIQYVINKGKDRDIYLTLTNGADTRIVFNSLLQSRINITAAITNSNYSTEDAKVAGQICRDFHVKLVDSKEFPDLTGDTFDNIFYLTNGMVDVITFINNYIKDSVIFYGSFGNFLSRRQYGNHRHMMNSGSKDQFINRFFTFIFTGFDYSLLKSILSESEINNIKSRFTNIFDQYFSNLDLKDSYYYFYKNIRNFYNDCRFATGVYTGSSGVFPFNNLELINLYNEFSFKETFSHKYHFMASYYRNPKLSTYRMGHFPLPVRYKPFFIYHLLEPLTSLQDAIRPKKYKSWDKAELEEYFMTGYDYSNYTHIYDTNSVIEKLSMVKSQQSLLNIIRWVTQMYFRFDEICKKRYKEFKKE